MDSHHITSFCARVKSRQYQTAKPPIGRSSREGDVGERCTELCYDAEEAIPSS